MSLFDIILVWIHLTAATFWVGGMLFLSLVAVPLLKEAPDPASAQREFVNLARRFRMLVGVALSLLLVTGVILLPNHMDFTLLLGEWPWPVLVKVSLVCLLIVLSVVHDQVIGPKVRTLKLKSSSELSVNEKFLLRLSPIIGRVTMLLGLSVFLVAVIMVRM